MSNGEGEDVGSRGVGVVRGVVVRRLFFLPKSHPNICIIGDVGIDFLQLFFVE